MDFSALKSRGIVIEENAQLWKWTTFQLGGPCPFLFTCALPQHLESTVEFLNQNKMTFILIGGGSNLVVADQGLQIPVIRYVSDVPIIKRNRNELTVSGSTSLDQTALFCAQNGLQGFNFAHGIPGTVGGAVIGNAGAFGKQVGDIVKTVTLLSPTGVKRDINSGEAGFSYRNSKLKETGEIVVSAVFALKDGDSAQLLKERDEFLNIRHEKHPDLKIHPCAGSFFRNIEPTSKAERRQATGWFLEQAGGKNLSAGGAVIYPKHANIIVKGPGCTAGDVYELSKKMADLAKKSFGLDLVREVRFVGRIAGVKESENSVIW